VPARGASAVRSRFVALLAAVAVVAAGALPATAGAADPSHVSSVLEGCKVTTTITLPNGDGKFICPNAAYTSGNLGKFWNELDLVPFRLTLGTGGAAPATQTYSLAVVLDNADGTPARPGYDVISAPTLNTSLSSAGCNAASDTGQQTTTNFGGIDQSIYRKITVTQLANTHCVYDYYGRLALGSHLFPGSALHANLANENLGTQGIGASDVSIPVNEILPQKLSKDMSALQDSDHAWSITKRAQPDHLSFTNTCDPANSRNAAVAVTIEWTKLAATPSGAITVVTHVYAENPAARIITVTTTDNIKSGTTNLETVSGLPVDVPANTKLLVLTHTMTVPSGTTDLNDVATATYNDKITNVAIPGTTEATATAAVQGSGHTTNASAVITDAESISGAFSYSADSFTPDIGDFDNGYVAGTPTGAETDWTSDSQSASGSVTFSKTVYVPAGSSDTGSLSDIAYVTGSDGFTANADASVALSSARQATISIVKHIPNVLQGSETASFTFDIVDAAQTVVETRTVTFAAGETTKTVDVSGLTPAQYTVVEQAAAGWRPQDSFPVDVSTACSGGAEFSNNFGPATADAHKITQPAGSASGWAMTLTGPGGVTETLSTDANGDASFATDLVEGSYTITEASQNGWTTVGSSGECSFTVNYPADADHNYNCTFTNRRPAHAAAVKITQPVGAEAGWTMTLSGPGAGSGGESVQTDANGNAAFTTDLAGGGHYTIAESNQQGWDARTPTGSCDFTVTYPNDAGRTFTCTFTNVQRAHVRVTKTVSGSSDLGGRTFTFQLRSGASPTSTGTTLETKTVDATHNPVSFATGLVPGATYQMCETLPGIGWMTSLFTGGGFTPNVVNDPLADNSLICHDFTATAGELKTIAVDNTPPPGGLALTIGYWKNHASCASSNGKQKQALDLVLASFPIAGGQTTHGVLIGSLYVDTCTEAVNLLDKSTIIGAKKMASDPAYNLAAQLMAVELNLQGGAGACGGLLIYRAQSQTLLAKYVFNGTSSYTSGASKMTAVDQTLANFLAGKLDKWNNNTLC
jgi:hypothetical protein